MSVLALAKTVTKDDVDLAWETFRSILIAEADNPLLADDSVHQQAQEIAKHRFLSLYREWVAQ